MSRDFTVFERYKAEVSYSNTTDVKSTNQFLEYIDLIFDYLNDVQKNKIFEAYKKYKLDDDSKFMYIDYIQPHKVKAYVLGNKLDLDLHEEFFSGAKALTHAIFAICGFSNNDFKRVFAVTNDNSKIKSEFIITDKKVNDEKMIFFANFYKLVLNAYLNMYNEYDRISANNVFIRRLFHYNYKPEFQRMRTTIKYPVANGVSKVVTLLDKDIETEAINNVYDGKHECQDLDDVTLNCIKHHILNDFVNFKCLVDEKTYLDFNQDPTHLDDIIKNVYESIDWYENI